MRLGFRESLEPPISWEIGTRFTRDHEMSLRESPDLLISCKTHSVLTDLLVGAARGPVQALELFDSLLVLAHLGFEHLFELERTAREPAVVRAFELHFEAVDLRLPRTDTIARMVEEIWSLGWRAVPHA